jgi:hypothetical protein
MANISWIESGRTELNRILRSCILELNCHMEAMITDLHCLVTYMHLDFCFRGSTAAAKQPVHCRTRTTANRSSLYCTTSSILAKPLAGRASSLFLFCNTTEHSEPQQQWRWNVFNHTTQLSMNKHDGHTQRWTFL